MHLHGIWSDPESIVLSTSDYTKIVQNEQIQGLRNGMALLRTFVFVGFGAGLNDPHFDAIWNWLRPLSATDTTHYVLCLERDLASVATANLGNPIVAISYGSEFGDLPGYIAKLVPSVKLAAPASMDDSKTFSQVLQTCRLKLLDSLSDTAVIPKPASLDLGQDLEIDDLVIEPIMLPVPPEQFGRERAVKDPVVTRLVPLEELRSSRFVILVGEEQSGLTTALVWAAVKRSDQSNCIPIYLDFLQLGTGNRMMQNAIRKYLRAVGAPLKQ